MIPCALDAGQQAALEALVLRGPDSARDGCATRRSRDLCRLAKARFGVAYAGTGMLRLVKDLGLSWQKARPINRVPPRLIPGRAPPHRLGSKGALPGLMAEAAAAERWFMDG